MKTGLSMGLHTPDSAPLSAVGSSGVEIHEKELSQNSFQPHGPFRRVHTIPVCAENSLSCGIHCSGWGEGGSSLRCTENLITGLGTRKDFLREKESTSSLLRKISRPISFIMHSFVE